MMYISSHLTTRLIAVWALALILSMGVSGCQQQAETNTADPAPNTQRESKSTASATPVAPAPIEEQAQAPLTILALGDSLTEGLGVDTQANYPAQLQARLQALGYTDVKVINSGLSGETSTGLVNRLDWVLQTQPDITILTIGANDAMRGIDVATVDANIRTAIKRLQDNGSDVILGGMQIYDNLGDDYVQSFAQIYPRIAQDMNVPLIPFFLAGVGGDPTLNQADGIHPTQEGYKIIVDNNILPLLQPAIEQRLTDDVSDTVTRSDVTPAPLSDETAP